MRMLRMAWVLCAGMGPAPAVAVEAWPTRPIKLVVPGTADLLARLVADRLGPALSQPVVVEHRPGAGGIVGQEQVARASPDGYTLVVSSLGSRILRYALSAAARSADGRRAWPRPLGVRFRVA